MALKATVFKAELQVSDLGRHHYATYNLTVARHPSETDERMMIRIIAFAIYADEQLTFTRGLSTDSEPELWRKSPTGDIDLWIELGQPDEKRIRKVCGKAGEVVIVSHGDRKAEPWWQKHADSLNRCANLSVLHLPLVHEKALESLVCRNMRLEVTIDDGHLWLTSGETAIDLTLETWK